MSWIVWCYGRNGFFRYRVRVTKFRVNPLDGMRLWENS